MHHVEIELLLELLAQQMGRCAYAGGRKVEFAGRGANERSQFLDVLRRYRLVDRKRGRKSDRQRYRCEVLERVIVYRLVERRVDHVVVGGDEERVTISLGSSRLFGADIAAGAAEIFN